jgi:HAD superfamily hydrolase (TIGR01509 family)
MNIFIPLGGKGERFARQGFQEPKALIPVLEKRMIQYVLDSIQSQFEEADKVFIFYNHRLANEHGFVEFIQSQYPNIHLIPVPDTKGAVETLWIGMSQLQEQGIGFHSKCLLLDCDTYYTQDVVSLFRQSSENLVFYTHNTSEKAIYSYIRLLEEEEEPVGRIGEIKEKQKISDNANTGAYAFTDFGVLYSYCQYVLENKIVFNNEPYTSCVISEMIKAGHEFRGVELDASRVFSLGTPEDVERFVKSRYAFLFDLDGTLVITEELYFDVWQTLLSQWNIHLTPEIFRSYIQGNNDKYVLNTLLYNVAITLEELSCKKDELFIEKIDKIKVVEGVYAFLEKIRERGHKMCIVTNCNRKVAEKIMEQTGIGKWMDFLVTSEDCVLGKPAPEPYLKAIARYRGGIGREMCLIFEDSKSGLLSAKSVGPKGVVGIETIYSTADMKKHGAVLSIRDFVGLEIESLMKMEKSRVEDIRAQIRLDLKLSSVSEIEMDMSKLKGGFIADVVGFKVKTEREGTTKSMVLKYETEESNPLSVMAKRLELYGREYYFYEHVSRYVPIRIPCFYGLLKNEEFENKGMMLENLLERGYTLNLDLNRESIEVSLKIVDRMAKFHTHFWNQPLKKRFPGLYKTNDAVFCPFFQQFIEERWGRFMEKWGNLMNPQQREKWEYALEHFGEIQERLATGDTLTVIHGDVKSPNLFYDVENGYEPYFIDWQHSGIGKGAQDVVFFLIESFDITGLKCNYPLLKNYYYKKVMEYGVQYSYDQYEQDIRDAVSYVPIFTAIWFGTTPQDELIDKNWPYFFICKCLTLLEMLS